MNRIIIFSHESDIDGMGSVILSKIAYKDIDYVLCHNPDDLEITFRKYIRENKLNKYEKIYVTDLALFDPALTLVAESDLKNKVLIFDHHKKAIDSNLNRYPFTKIIEEDNTGKRCATDLFYEFLVKSKIIKRSKILDTFVEYTRLEDTWEWKKITSGDSAHDLAILFNCIGIEKYIAIMLKKLLHEKEFYYTDEEINIISRKKEEYKKNIEKILKNTIYLKDELNNKFGIAIAPYEYRNEIPEFIIENNNPNEIAYFITVALNKGEYGQKSYRSIIKGFDVNEICKAHGGGGHKEAAAVSISKEQRKELDSLADKDKLVYIANAIYKSEK